MVPYKNVTSQPIFWYICGPNVQGLLGQSTHLGLQTLVPQGYQPMSGWGLAYILQELSATRPDTFNGCRH